MQLLTFIKWLFSFASCLHDQRSSALYLCRGNWNGIYFSNKNIRECVNSSLKTGSKQLEWIFLQLCRQVDQQALYSCSCKIDHQFIVCPLIISTEPFHPCDPLFPTIHFAWVQQLLVVAVSCSIIRQTMQVDPLINSTHDLIYETVHPNWSCSHTMWSEHQ